VTGIYVDGQADDPIVNAAGEVQSTLVDRLGTIGPVPLVVALVVLLAGVLLLARRRTRAE
jgi:cytochrome c-type biogenesis protein